MSVPTEAHELLYTLVENLEEVAWEGAMIQIKKADGYGHFFEVRITGPVNSEGKYPLAFAVEDTVFEAALRALHSFRNIPKDKENN